jgi:spermidine synthase
MAIGTIVRLILAALILGPPTFLMGGTLPAAARAVVTAEDISRRTVGINANHDHNAYVWQIGFGRTF